MGEVDYEPETTQIQRAELLKEVKEKAYGPGVDALRAVLRDLDRAESCIAAWRAESEAANG